MNNLDRLPKSCSACGAPGRWVWSESSAEWFFERDAASGSAGVDRCRHEFNGLQCDRMKGHAGGHYNDHTYWAGVMSDDGPTDDSYADDHIVNDPTQAPKAGWAPGQWMGADDPEPSAADAEQDTSCADAGHPLVGSHPDGGYVCACGEVGPAAPDVAADHFEFEPLKDGRSWTWSSAIGKWVGKERDAGSAPAAGVDLGVPTTAELLDELITRCELNGWLSELHKIRNVRTFMPKKDLAYRSVDSAGSQGDA